MIEVNLGKLRFDEGAHLLVKRGIDRAEPGEDVLVRGEARDLELQLQVWGRSAGHKTWRDGDSGGIYLRRGAAHTGRWQGAEQAGHPNPRVPGGVSERPPTAMGTGRPGRDRRGPEPPDFSFPLDDKHEVWANEAARLYASAVASQWDPNTAVPWDEPFDLPDEVEDAVVQLMTYLIENETAALVVPSRFVAQLHPHFREVMQLSSHTGRRRSPPCRSVHPPGAAQARPTGDFPPSAAKPR